MGPECDYYQRGIGSMDQRAPPIYETWCRTHALRRFSDSHRVIELSAALVSVLADIEEYERINNLSPSPGKRDCWQSVTHAKAVLAGI